MRSFAAHPWPDGPYETYLGNIEREAKYDVKGIVVYSVYFWGKILFKLARGVVGSYKRIA